MKVIFLNGPPGSGKDFAGTLIAGQVDPDKWVEVDKFARQLKEATHRLYGITTREGGPAPHNMFESIKEIPNPKFLGLSPRAAYQKVSEVYFKPVHGDKVFGEMLLKDIEHMVGNATILVITDSGFRGEAEVLVAKAGSHNCMVIQLHAEGCTFEGDTRGYIDLSDIGVRTVPVVNPMTPEGLWANLCAVASDTLISQKEDIHE